MPPTTSPQPWALAALLLSASPALGQALPDKPLIPVLEQHDKPSPFSILPLFDAGWTPGEMPYRTDAIRPDAGVLGSVLSSSRPWKAGVGYSGQGDAREAFLQGAWRGAEGFIMGTGIVEKAGDYEDGDGRTVRFGYERNTEQLVVGWTPQPGMTLRALLLHDEIDNHILPLATPVTQNGVNLVEGFGADPVLTRRLVANLGYEQKTPMPGIDRWFADLRYTLLDRSANNYELRTTPAANLNRANPTRETGGISGGADFHLGSVASRLTLSGNHIWHDATRRGGPGLGNLNVISGYQYPGVTMWESAVNFDNRYDIATDQRLLFGMRYDYVSASASRLDNPMRVGSGAAAYGGTPRQLIESYYGKGAAEDRDDHMLSGKLALEQDFDRVTLTGSVARIMRAADTQERYFSLPSMANATANGYATRQVGNPALDPEQHYRAELGLAWKGTGWRETGRKPADGRDWLDSSAWKVSLTGYADRTIDFISRDRAHGQDGILRADNAFIWRNVDAQLAGLVFDARWALTSNLTTRVNLAWQYGENTADGRALYGINPLEANLLVDWQDQLGTVGTWNIGAKTRLVARQSRLDDNPATGSGFDPSNTGSFAVVDLYGGVQLHDRIGLRVGINNLFDATYAEHNPLTSTDETNPSAVFAPGRTVYVRAVVNF